jgi:hypothetical protein
VIIETQSSLPADTSAELSFLGENFIMRTVIIATTAATLFSSVAFTQESGQSTASIPDFSGIRAHVSLPAFEPPLSGPGPVLNRSRLPNGVGNLSQLVGDYTNPILKPWAAEVVKKDGEISLSGVPYPNPINHCWPWGVPLIFSNIGIQMLQQPHQITILYAENHQFRQVRMNEPHRAQLTPSWYGDSFGHYEGDTLVIDTVGIKIGPFAMIDWYGTPHTKFLHVVERYRLIDYEAAQEAQARDKENLRLGIADVGFADDPDYKGKALSLEFTVEDVGALTVPWSATVTYRRPLGEWPESVCAENPHGYFHGTLPGKQSALPTANNLDF